MVDKISKTPRSFAKTSKIECYGETSKPPVDLGARRITRCMDGSLPRNKDLQNMNPQVFNLSDSNEEPLKSNENFTYQVEPHFTYDSSYATRDMNTHVRDHIEYSNKEVDQIEPNLIRTPFLKILNPPFHP